MEKLKIWPPPPRGSHKNWQKWTPTPVQKFVTIRLGVSFPRMRDFARQIAHQKVLVFLGSCNSLQPKNRLAMGMLPLEHLLIVIVDA